MQGNTDHKKTPHLNRFQTVLSYATLMAEHVVDTLANTIFRVGKVKTVFRLFWGAN